MLLQYFTFMDFFFTMLPNHVVFLTEARNHSNSFLLEQIWQPSQQNCPASTAFSLIYDHFFTLFLQNLHGTARWVITPVAFLTASPVQLSIWVASSPFPYTAATSEFLRSPEMCVICNPASSKIRRSWGRRLRSQAAVRWPPKLIPTLPFRSWKRETSEVILVKLAPIPLDRSRRRTVWKTLSFCGQVSFNYLSRISKMP